MADLVVGRTYQGRGRTVPRTTALGKIIHARGMRAYEVAGQAGISTRLLTELLHGRRVMSTEQRARLAKVLDVPVQVLED